MPSPRLVVTILCALVSRSADGHAQVTRDSAGMRIVAYPRTATARATWSLGQRPLLEFGAAGDTASEFSGVRGVVRLSNGGVAVANGASNEIRVFARDGQFVRALGRAGSGPGEFRRITRLLRRGDTIVGVDGDTRAHVFDPSGRLVRSLRPARRAGSRNPQRIALGAGPRSWVLVTDGAPTDERERQVIFYTLTVADAEGDSLLPVVTMPGYRTSPINGTPARQLLEAEGVVAASESRACTGYSDQLVITCHEPSGRARVRISRDIAPRPIREDERALVRQAYLDANRDAPPAVRQQMTTAVQAFTYARGPDGQGLHGFGYARYDNPNRHALEVAVAALEGGAAGMAFSSGSAVTTAVCRALGPDALVLAPDDLFYGTRTLLNGTLKEWGLKSQFIDMSDLAALRAALAVKPRLVWLETPSNPRLRVTDLAAASTLAHEAGALVVADNTWATPTLQTPIALGADVVVHSAVKYFGGHSDTSAGLAVVAREDAFSAKLREIQRYEGAVPSPFDSWLVHRGLHSLPARMRQHCDTAAAVAEFLASHPRVDVVHYPGLRSHPGHLIAAAQMKASGGMVSFQVRGGRDEAIGVTSRARLFTRAGSLGGVESLIQHHATVEGPGSKTPQNLLRLSIGLEHPQDLMDDLDQALGRVE